MSFINMTLFIALHAAASLETLFAIIEQSQSARAGMAADNRTDIVDENAVNGEFIFDEACQELRIL